MKRRVALATTAGVLGMAGTALAAGPAAAAQYNLTYSQGGAAVPVGTTYTATSSSIALTSVNSPYGAIVSCTGTSSLSGKTDTIGSGSVSAGLTVTGGSFNGCVINASGLGVTVTGNYSPAWQVTPTGGTTTPFTGTVSNVSATITCGSSNSATYTGTLGSGGTENNVASGSNITLTHASSLTKSSSTGTGCALPTTVDVTGKYTVATVGGTAVSSSNNLWLNYS